MPSASENVGGPEGAEASEWQIADDWKSSGYPSASSRPTPPPPPPAPPAADDPPAQPAYEVVTGPLPVCEYTGEPGEEPCEEPATVKRWSSGAVIVAAALGALAGGILVAAAVIWISGVVPGLRPYVQEPLGAEAR